MYYRVEKTKVLISFAVTHSFSHDAAHIRVDFPIFIIIVLSPLSFLGNQE